MTTMVTGEALRTCRDCGRQAFTAEDEDVRYGDNGHGSIMAYSLKPEYYQPMCIDYHRAFDADHREGPKAA